MVEIKEGSIIYNQNLDLIKKAFKETDVICIIDKKGKILYYNNYNDIHNKIGTEDVVGKPFLEVYPWLSDKTSTALTVLKTGQAIINQPQIMELYDGSKVNSINTAFPLKNQDGILGVVFLSYDINTIFGKTELKDDDKFKVNLGAKYTFDDIITENLEMMQIINKLKKIARYNSNIFMYGETGTGKELFVQSVHNASNRAEKPFISQNCAAIPVSLMEGLIFGTTTGSFTGAVDKQGLFELANGGTIFLDEINSMPLDLQAKLLRVIETKRVRRIGGKEEMDVDVRIIASTNEPPDELLENKTFRKDLFYRLGVVNIEIPPLRERKEDILPLTKHFVRNFNQLFNKKIEGMDTQVQKLFMEYEWPGNVREYKNAIESAFNCVEGNKILLYDIPNYIIKRLENKSVNKALEITPSDFTLQETSTLQDNFDALEKYMLLEALKKTGNNITKASNILGITRQSIYNKIKKHQINLND